MITIGLPAYNAEKYIQAAVSSVLMQSYPHWRLIIIDDGSTDETYLKIKAFKDDQRITIVKSEKNKGLICRLNELVALSDTPYFARMDADDMMHPDRIRLQVEYLNNHPDINVVGAQAISIDDNNRVKGLKAAGNDFSTKTLLQGFPFIHPTVCGRTTWFKANPYRQQYFRAEDKELWLRTGESGAFFNLQKPLLFYREGNINVANYLHTAKTVRRIFKDYQQKFDNRLSYYFALIKVDIKVLVYKAFSKLNAIEILTDMRSKPLQAIEKKEYERVIHQILHHGHK